MRIFFTHSIIFISHKRTTGYLYISCQLLLNNQFFIMQYFRCTFIRWKFIIEYIFFFFDHSTVQIHWSIHFKFIIWKIIVRIYKGLVKNQRSKKEKNKIICCNYIVMKLIKKIFNVILQPLWFIEVEYIWFLFYFS